MVKQWIVDEGELAALIPDRERRAEFVSRLIEVRSDGVTVARWSEDRRPHRVWREVLGPPDERWVDFLAETPEGWVALAIYDHDGMGGGSRMIRRKREGEG